MKSFFRSLVLVAATTGTAVAQGRVEFNNISDTLNASDAITIWSYNMKWSGGSGLTNVMFLLHLTRFAL